MKNIIWSNIDYIRNNLQIVTISFKGVSLGYKKISLDELFMLITEERNAINRINKTIDVFRDTPEIIRISNSIKNKLYKFRDSRLIKTDDREYVILKKDKEEFCNELDKLINTYRNEICKSLRKTNYKKGLINNIYDVIKEVTLINNKFEYLRKITRHVNYKTKNIEVNIDKCYKFYDISEDLLKDNKFCETLVKTLDEKDEKKLISTLRDIERYNVSYKQEHYSKEKKVLI